MQELLVTWFGATGATVVRYALALAVVAGLLLLLRWVLRNYATGGQLSIGRSRQNRLTIVEQIALDQRRRLLLVRRDGVEHLILVGGGNDLVVEPTIIRGVPVGSLGRTARPAVSSTASSEESEATAAETPAVGAAPVAPMMEAPATVRPVPIPRPAAAVEPARPAFPSHVAGEHPKATSIQSRLNRAQPRTPDASRGAAPSPYIPPEAHRVEPTVAPISPIVSDKQSSDLPEPHEAPQMERKSEPARPVPASVSIPPVEDSPGFDDLARQLDEALKSEIEEMKIEAAEPPAAAPEPAPKPEPAKPTTSAASAWLRPRATQAPRPIAPREPSVAREPVATREPSAQATPTRSPLRQPVAEPRIAEPRSAEPAAEPVAAPEPVVTPRVTEKPVAEKPEDDVRTSPEFSSLEDEMARLLDDLAGDSKGKR
ncbi:flagellar biosynthetic protein FliO [Pleomorphomonas sp. JP5]|uniref:flagellar biosynthetic protein FliO n=1 Tax=Pleomorphomonas sp. JP5 TaxID=2942998 RepID=UPI0020435FA0|nr:flagellar biosynthetic protein FliO [Pleomorphomonas sp. JP5]MCM5559475.1 flagellar biosynthetic protein FliO [Pleomorphomonas sp. JP5]